FDEIIKPVDLVLDTAGGERLERSASMVRPGGRLVSVAAEPPKEQAAAYGIQAIYFVVEPNGAQLRELTKLAEDGTLRPTVAEVFPLAEARKAFERSLSPHAAGKIVLRIVDE
ncbi:MAG TPA: zinc-binding dehydrogenase, partial [Anaerolineales bacterium]|nr:zinc-binding dehydrogenase [Anaerolineales bacterium]